MAETGGGGGGGGGGGDSGRACCNCFSSDWLTDGLEADRIAGVFQRVPRAGCAGTAKEFFDQRRPNDVHKHRRLTPPTPPHSTLSPTSSHPPTSSRLLLGFTGFYWVSSLFSWQNDRAWQRFFSSTIKNSQLTRKLNQVSSLY